MEACSVYGLFALAQFTLHIFLPSLSCYLDVAWIFTSMQRHCAALQGLAMTCPAQQLLRSVQSTNSAILSKSKCVHISISLPHEETLTVITTRNGRLPHHASLNFPSAIPVSERKLIGLKKNILQYWWLWAGAEPIRILHASGKSVSSYKQDLQQEKHWAITRVQ